MNNKLNDKTKEYIIKLKDCLKVYKNKEVVLFCVGNYKVWFDCFGPTVAETLRRNNINCFIYGGFIFNVCAININEYMCFIKQKHPDACIIIVDNCISLKPYQNTEVVISKNKTIPACFTNMQPFGDISILLKTHIYSDPFIFLEKQNEIVFNICESIKNVLLSVNL